MRISGEFLFFVILTLPGVTSAGNDEIQKLLNNYVVAVNTLDLELGSEIWSQNADISFIHPRGHQKGWEDIKSSFYLGTMGNFSKRTLRLKNISIRILNDETAWADFYWDFDAVFKHDGSSLKSQGRETQIFRKEKAGWKIVHVHYSGPALQGEREGF